MGRVVAVLLTLAVALGVAGTAEARRAKVGTRKVTIETTPAGATVYIGDTESGSRGTTPVTLALPLGETTLILERQGYQTRFETLEVVAAKRRDRTKAQRVTFELEVGVARLLVAEPAGARVMVDGAFVGEVPLDLEVETGAHVVQVMVEGQEPHEEFLEFAGGQALTVTPVFSAPVVMDDRTDDEEVPPETGEARRPAAVAPRRDRPRASIAVGLQLGQRDVTYRDVETPATLLPLTQRGAATVRVDVSLGVGELSGVAWLRPLALELGVGVGIPQEVMSETLGMLETRWWRASADLRYRPRLRGPLELVLGGGLVDERYAFSGAPADVAVVPDAETVALRAEGGPAFRHGRVYAAVLAEGRAILGGGALADRFGDSAGGGYGASLEVDVTLPASLRAGLEAGVMRTRWNLAPSADGTYAATGATDDVRVLTFRLARTF